MSARPIPRRGRPPKFGRPSHVVAVTLPEEVIRGLRRINADVGWAIVSLFSRAHRGGQRGARRHGVAELVAIGRRHSLIVVDRSLVRRLPGVDLVPINSTQALLAVAPGHGVGDIELAVLDRLDFERVRPAERDALTALRAKIRQWRRDPALQFRTRGIVIVDHGVNRRAGRR